ncbi:MAG: DUF502 domain-containing protein [Candidatus Eisenbacteria bacterium]|nr:DUF502 domain-containing protein [Candidatus Eisenbacteria bacterium]
MNSLARFLRHSFLAGILVIVPLGVTYLILKLVFNAVDNILAPYIERLIGLDIPGLGVAATIVLVFLAGLVATNVLGKTLLNYFHRGVSKIPVVGSVYVSAKQVIEALGTADTQSFKRVVFIEYPRNGLLMMGFVTREHYAVIDKQGNKTEVINVFLPTTPNPTTGFLVVCRSSDAIRAGITVEQGIKLVVSGGIVAPPEPLMVESTEALLRENETSA